MKSQREIFRRSQFDKTGELYLSYKQIKTVWNWQNSMPKLICSFESYRNSKLKCSWRTPDTTCNLVRTLNLPMVLNFYPQNFGTFTAVLPKLLTILRILPAKVRFHDFHTIYYIFCCDLPILFCHWKIWNFVQFYDLNISKKICWKSSRKKHPF